MKGLRGLLVKRAAKAEDILIRVISYVHKRGGRGIVRRLAVVRRKVDLSHRFGRQRAADITPVGVGAPVRAGPWVASLSIR